jgi:tricorn protease
MRPSPCVRFPLWLVAALTLASASVALADDDAPLWLRHPALSPDGQTVAFDFQGNLYTVPAAGGLATPVTLHPDHDRQPVWSPDGKWLAFASDRHGNWDIFLVPARGGQVKRLTHHSGPDTPCSFTPDGKHVLFTATRLDAAKHAEFPHYRALPELYQVPVDGGRPEQVLTIPALEANFDPKGERLLYIENTSLEDLARKHNISAFARDVWLWEKKENTFTRLTTFPGGEFTPVWDADGQGFHYLSERSGDFNVWHLPLIEGAEPRQITRHKKHPVRSLSQSRDGTLCYSFDGEIYLLDRGAKSGKRLPVMIRAEDPNGSIEHIKLSRGITEFDLSPTGKEIAFINRGEIFVTAVDHDLTKRITSTPEQERSVSFSPDGRSLVYAGERGQSWNLYRTDLVRDEEPYFFGATLLEETTLLDSKKETFQPAWSPDGKEVAYLEERTELKVLNLESGDTRTILPRDRNYSYADGDQWYEWSPDGQWFLVNFLSKDRWSGEVGLVGADGKGEVKNLTLSGYEDGGMGWAMNGKMMLWYTDKNGLREHGGWRTTGDIYGMFFTQEAYDEYHMTEAELALAKALKDDDKDKKEDKGKEKDGDKKDGADKEDKEKKDQRKYPDGFKPRKMPEKPLEIDLDEIQDRTTRMTIHSSSLGAAELTEDGETLYYLARFEKGMDIWKYEHRKGDVKLLAKLGAERVAGFELSPDEKSLFLLADGRLQKVDVGKGSPKPISFSATMELDRIQERAYMFEHVWRQTLKKFYVQDMHGVDWKYYKKAYARFLPWINNNHDFADLLSEMLGELNASHTGARHNARHENADATAALGAFFDPDHEGDGLKILEIIDKGPLVKAKAGLKAGMIIDKIDGAPIKKGENWYPLLNHKAGKTVLLSITDPNPDKDKGEGKNREVTVKPISTRAQLNLLYERWIESRRAETERLSGGRLGYAHVRSMNSRSFRDAFADILGRYSDKEGLVVDTRFNSGGNLTEALVDFLSGVPYARNNPRGQIIGREPSMSWSRPSIVVQNEGNYSDAHYFPWAYRELGIGKLVGTQVPGTATAVWWETLQDRSVYFGIPMVGVMDNRDQLLENQNLEPDYHVDNEPRAASQGRDQQLEKAVEVLLEQIDE